MRSPSVKLDGYDTPLVMPGGGDVQMDEIEHVRYLLEERNRDFVGLSNLSHHDLLDLVGREPGVTLGKVAALRLEDAKAAARLGSDAREALEDVATIAIKSMNGPLAESEIWRLCYRLAYLVGYGIHVTRDAREAIEKDRTRVARAGGESRWKHIGPIREHAHRQLPSICYDSSGKRLTKGTAIESIMAELAQHYPEGDIPEDDTIGDWLKSWRAGLGYKDWRHLPQRLEDWPTSPLKNARKLPPKKG